MNRRHLLPLACLVVVLAACSRGDKPAAEQGHDHGPGADHGHGALAHTLYGKTTELFVEFPVPARGEKVAFAAHLTRLADFKPVAEGILVVTLSGGNAPPESAMARVSDTPGIFRPAITPKHAGKRRLVFTLEAGGASDTHDLGEIEVFPDAKAAAAAAPREGAAGEGIKYTKEAQWKADFAAAPAEERTVRESVAATATLRPRGTDEAQVVATTAGVLRPSPSGLPLIGSRVEAGQVLAYLVPRLGGEVDVATLEAAVERWRAESAQAAEERARVEGLLRAEAVPEKRVTEARARERIARAELDAATRRLGAYQGGGGGIALKSPVAGTVVATNAQSGAAVTEGQLLFHVANLDTLWLEARIAEADLGKVTRPAGAFFRVEGRDEAIVLQPGRNARLVAFGGLVDRETRTAPAIFEFDNRRERLGAGLGVRAGVYTGRETRGVAVPASAVIDESGQQVVYVQKEGELFERRVVAPGPRDGDWLAIRSGVQAGERVVTRGAYQVRLAAASPGAMGHGHAH